MSIFSLSLTEIFKNLLEIGANLTEQQTELLKWRFSDEANKYYNEKENNEFYSSLMKGNIEIVDAIRKEKQQRIDEMKQDLLKVIIILLFPVLCTSCGFLNPARNIDMKVIEQKWDSNSLTERDKTYKFSDQTIRLNNDLTSTKFKGDWFVVNQDFIKVYNENQDTLINSLKKLKEVKEQSEAKEKIIRYSLIGLIAFLILTTGALIIRRKS